MTSMQGNPHYDEAAKIASPITDSQMFDRQFYIVEANLHASLALAHEQRTANLIALWTAPMEPGAELAGVDYGNIAAQIIERLGLK